MRAITVDGQVPAPALREDLPEPIPAEDEVLVRVHASSVNPVDNAIATGMLAGMGVEHEYPVTLGRDYADPAVHAGGWAELITVTEELSIAPVPEGVDLAVAGAAPLAGVTALAAVDALELALRVR